MKKILSAALILSLATTSFETKAQILEWRIGNYSYINTDPDGAGPATGTISFTLQIHAQSGTVSNITGISTGWCWQSAAAMVPTGVPCGTNSIPQPANIAISSAFTGFTYNNVDECSGTVSFSTGGQTFDRRAVGSLDGGTINISTTWLDMFTVTLWSKGTSFPQAGYVALNSGEGGSPGTFTTYSVSDNLANTFPVNSLTYSTPLALGATVPVAFSSFSVSCQASGSVEIRWSTETEINSSEFVIQKSSDGTVWSEIGRLNAAGNSNIRKEYRFTYNQNGNAMYRVKLLDISGNTTFTDIRSADCGLPASVSVYPLPAKNILHVNIPSGSSQRVQLVLTDVSGRKVLSSAGLLTEGMNPFSLNVTALPPGCYILQVLRESRSAENIRVIKQ